MRLAPPPSTSVLRTANPGRSEDALGAEEAARDGSGTANPGGPGEVGCEEGQIHELPRSYPRVTTSADTGAGVALEPGFPNVEADERQFR